MSIRSSASRRRVALQFTARPLGGCGGVFVWFQGVIAEALLFLPVTVNNTTVAMVTEAEQLCLELELINIEEQMLILQMLKRNIKSINIKKYNLKNHCKVQSNNTTHTHT